MMIKKVNINGPRKDVIMNLCSRFTTYEIEFLSGNKGKINYTPTQCLSADNWEFQRPMASSFSSTSAKSVINMAISPVSSSVWILNSKKVI